MTDGNKYLLISESGVYHAVFKSKKPQAKTFRKWVTTEVLPSIRKTGQFGTTLPIEQPQLPSLELTVARELVEISDLLAMKNPRAAQLLSDSLLNRALTALPANDEPKLYGVVELAEQLGYKLTMGQRSQLGKHVKKVLPPTLTEERLCNGTMRSINLYSDTPELRQVISNYFDLAKKKTQVNLTSQPVLYKRCTVIIDDEPWFVAADVAYVLEYTKTQSLVDLLDTDEKQTLKASDIKGYASSVTVLDPDNTYTFISESGVYHASRWRFP